MNIISEWVKNIFVMIATITFVEILMPSGCMEKYVKFIFSIIILATILLPLTKLLS